MRRRTIAREGSTMPIIDISVSLNITTPVWPGSPKLKQKWVKRISSGDVSNDSIISCDSHIGTHVDAPLHFIEGGSSVEAMPLEILCGRTFVANYGNIRSIGVRELESTIIPDGIERVLLKTGNSLLWKENSFNADFASLTEDGARWLVRRGVKLVGIDYLSVGPYPEGSAVHRILLGAGIVVVEGLDLSKIVSGIYKLVCLPLKIAGAEGAPARAVLMPLGDETL